MVRPRRLLLALYLVAEIGETQCGAFISTGQVFGLEGFSHFPEVNHEAKELFEKVKETTGGPDNIIVWFCVHVHYMWDNYAPVFYKTNEKKEKKNTKKMDGTLTLYNINLKF